ncbi:Allophanate hydrolase subunit 1 [Blastococcus saxobsidens DD2]|uniref:Allophanate hydrolase subunit 1 n=1 Tax=Blastococcus saxobsidens (strain DD2) TaxID=1146883 RepID=H6RUE8_BLASD|nr:Allophanate hydrolase subunit 1 [Blastococcus saxobsidens DD2]
MADRGDVVDVVRYGDRALLVEAAEPGTVPGLRAALAAGPLDGQVDLVPAARTLLVVLDRPPTDLDAAALRRLVPVPPAAGHARAPLDLPVVFDGPDLADVARLTGRSPEAVVAMLADLRFTVAFGGFAPGFGYLTGLPPELHVPRRATPRTRVPAGSSAWPARTRGSTRGPRPAAGSWSAAPTRCSSTSTGTRLRCWRPGPTSGSGRCAECSPSWRRARSAPCRTPAAPAGRRSGCPAPGPPTGRPLSWPTGWSATGPPRPCSR